MSKLNALDVRARIISVPVSGGSVEALVFDRLSEEPDALELGKDVVRVAHLRTSSLAAMATLLAAATHTKAS